MSVRDYTLRIEFIPGQPYDAMEAQYNSRYHTDMEPQHVRIHPSESHSNRTQSQPTPKPTPASMDYYDGVETWLNRGARAFMKRPPWEEVVLSGACLDEVRELGNLLAQVDRQRLERAVDNSVYLPGLVEKIDRCIREHRGVSAAVAVAGTAERDSANPNTNTNTKVESNPPIFCRINECSMKQSSGYTARPCTSGSSILTSLLTDRRAISWLSDPRHAIASTTLYLSDFDTSFACTNEYRVFVWEGRVTGVSQYRWFVTEQTEYHTEESARAVCGDIVRFMEGKEEGLLVALAECRRKERLAREPSVPLPAEAETMREMTLVADVVHTEGRVYLVEINLFGGETGCGSSLFHWKRDETVLYSDGKDIVGRFLARSEELEPDALKT